MSGIIKALGLVFGDIGTSPIYTVTVIFLLLEPTPENITGVMSLIIWTLIILVSIQFDFLAMSLSRRGEGGKIVLKEILVSLLKDKRETFLITMLTFVGVSLLMGDGVITPAISILSAVEGSRYIGGLENISQGFVVLISIIIAVILFSFQKKGTEKVAFTFGPVMLIWFSSLFFLGIISIIQSPEILFSLNPYYGVKFLIDNGWKGYFVLAEVILCATGGEALYADMGHLGARPIKKAWLGVFTALSINYLGQGAFLLRNPSAKNILFEMVLNYAGALYIPFLLLSIFATIIASQAMISGMFSIVYQAISTRILPVFKIDYTSIERKSQIYIGAVNWFLCVAVIFIMVEFGESSRLASAYGLAVTGTMVITAIMMSWIFYLKKNRKLMLLGLFVLFVDLVFFTSTFSKIPTGGYWSLVLALFPFFLIFLFTQGQRRLYSTMTFMPLEEFLIKFNKVYPTNPKVNGTALFLLKDVNQIPPYIIETMFYHGIVYEDNIFVVIIKRDDPYGATGYFKEELATGLRVFEIQAGYMEVFDVEEILRENGIEERAIFYGIEDISSENPIWKTFSLIKRVTPTFINFYRFPFKKLHGVITEVML